MTFTCYPKGLLITAVFLVMFGATLALAVDVRRGIAVAGALSIAAYLLVELFVVFNGQIVPALDQWQGAVLIAVAIVVGYAARWLQRDHRLAL